MENGQYKDNIGSANISAFCNDPNGFAIYAIGYTEDTYGNNKPAGARFKVSYIDDMGGMHGNWLAPQSGSLAIIIEHDKFKSISDD